MVEKSRLEFQQIQKRQKPYRETDEDDLSDESGDFSFSV